MSEKRQNDHQLGNFAYFSNDGISSGSNGISLSRESGQSEGGLVNLRGKANSHRKDGRVCNQS